MNYVYLCSRQEHIDYAGTVERSIKRSTEYLAVRTSSINFTGPD